MTKKSRINKEEKLVERLLKAKLDSYTPDFKIKFAAQEKFEQMYLAKQNNFSIFDFFRNKAISFAIVLLIITGIGTTSYIFLSPNINQQSNFYPVKQFGETLEYKAAFSKKIKITTLLKFNEKRSSEIETLSKKGIVDFKAIDEIKENTEKAYEIAQTIESPEERSRIEDKISSSSEEVNKKIIKAINPLIKLKTPEKAETTPILDEEFPRNHSPVLSAPSLAQPTNQCQLGASICEGSTTKTCGDFNNDGYSEWQFDTCSSNQVCKNGGCFNLPEGINPADFEQEL